MKVPYTAEFYERWKTTSLESAGRIVPYVLELVPARAVVDVGCGVGAWLSAFAACGVGELRGVDGDHVDRRQLLIPPQRFSAQDLSRQLVVGGTFDLAVSLEVAEHLPERRARSFVADLVALAPAVLFSAAIPFQEGEGHLNEQWPSYWTRHFAEHDYAAVDCIRERFWNDPRVEYWYAQNTVLYVRRSALESGTAALREALSRAHPGEPLPLVHPLRYLALADPRRMSLARSVRTFPVVLASMLKRRLGRG